MSTGTNKERITQNNGIISDNNADLTALKTRINNLPTSGDTTATAEDIALGKTAVSKGVKLTGAVPIGSSSMATTYGANNVSMYQGDVLSSTEQALHNQFFNVGDKISILSPASDVATVAGLTPEILKKDETVLGVTGTYEGTKAVLPDGVKFGLAKSLASDFSWLADVDTSNLTNASNMFYNCNSLTTIGLFNTSNVTRMNTMFQGCSNLTSMPLLDTSNVTTMASMFLGCSSLTSMPLLDTSKVTNMDSTFSNCSSLTTIPQLDTSGVISMRAMFGGCSDLTTVPQLDLSSATNISNMFASCPSLSNDSLNNILAMCIGATSYTGTKTLAELGLTQTQAETCQTLSNWDAFVAAGWTSRLLE